MSGWLRIRLTGNRAATYTAVLLGEGFQDPPLRINPELRWAHVAIIAACAFVIGVVVYQIGWGMK